MSLDRKRWLLLAQELKFSQLGIARKQADTWRVSLATLATLLTGVLIVKGRSDASMLPTWYQILVAGLLALALALLLTATMWLSRALAGPSNQQILLTGESLEKWTVTEVGKIARALSWAPGMAVASVVLIAAAVGVTWFAPAARQQPVSPLVKVTVAHGQSCGALVGETRRAVILATSSGGPPAVIPVSSVLAMAPVISCGLSTGKRRAGNSARPNSGHMQCCDLAYKSGLPRSLPSRLRHTRSRASARQVGCLRDFTILFDIAECGALMRGNG